MMPADAKPSNKVRRTCDESRRGQAFLNVVVELVDTGFESLDLLLLRIEAFDDADTIQCFCESARYFSIDLAALAKDGANEPKCFQRDEAEYCHRDQYVSGHRRRDLYQQDQRNHCRDRSANHLHQAGADQVPHARLRPVMMRETRAPDLLLSKKLMGKLNNFLLNFHP